MVSTKSVSTTTTRAGLPEYVYGSNQIQDLLAKTEDPRFGGKTSFDALSLGQQASITGGRNQTPKIAGPEERTLAYNEAMSHLQSLRARLKEDLASSVKQKIEQKIARLEKLAADLKGGISDQHHQKEAYVELLSKMMGMYQKVVATVSMSPMAGSAGMGSLASGKIALLSLVKISTHMSQEELNVGIDRIQQKYRFVLTKDERLLVRTIKEVENMTSEQFKGLMSSGDFMYQKHQNFFNVRMSAITYNHKYMTSMLRNVCRGTGGQREFGYA